MVSSKSDVLSFGVTVWEIFSYGETPYGSRMDNRTIKKQGLDGFRLECPIDSPEDVFQLLMSDCWLEDPIDRPSFSKILKDVRQLRRRYPDE